ncbi:MULTISPECIES: cell surface protein SprA [unclassified Dysgonomonas]|uniref:T9SS outer membrane translocon Sov/SprA n=1 Tax=unclassified Dysgonomonas TaxID=2630389 RepID=UPI002476FEE5|nr:MULTISPECIES: cell surface protein SprA [unclassified Dysgonomonas]
MFVSCLSIWALTQGGQLSSFPVSLMSGSMDVQQTPPPSQDDSKVRFDVKKTQPQTVEDLNVKPPIDLRDPSNIQSEVVYDDLLKMYLFRTKVGDGEWTTTMTMTPREYHDYMLNRSMSDYFKTKYVAEQGKDTAGDFSLRDVKISLGAAERIFGPGGVRVKTQGYVEVKMGMKHSFRDDPSISEKNRSRMMFDFDEEIKLNVKASVGDKVNFDMNYDTGSTFDFDSKKLKLGYEGKEDEIVKRLEAGNISMQTTNSLINGSSSLFGIRSDLQFGKFKVSAVVSQQEAQSQTVGSQGGIQTTPFEFMADQYDENRHFFLGHYFRDNYDYAMSSLPTVKSQVRIKEMEVWITNKRGNYDQARNIVAFADLGETGKIKNDKWTPLLSASAPPQNRANSLYSSMTGTYSGIRDISQVNNILQNQVGLESGLDYEKVENARLLSPSEYTYTPETGFISLKSALQSDEVLAVAYKYEIQGTTYNVGEMSSEVTDTYRDSTSVTTDALVGGALILKLLKPVALSPDAYTWDLMMKNVYSLNAYGVQEDRFRLNISYQSDTTGTYVNYIQDGNIKDSLLLRVMGLDRLNTKKAAHPDGIFDFVEGYTVLSSNGRIIFPVVEPFGSHLENVIGDTIISNKYVYKELYNSTLTEAQQVAEKNKFKISGSYKSTSTGTISLNATNVAKGSVVVKSGGIVLTEGVDYTVDYLMGQVTIINDAYSNSATPLTVSLENQSLFSMQRKTVLGLNLSYDFSKDFTIGGTIMHLSEKPLTTKTEVGSESLKNTIWGLNMSYRTESQWLTNLVDKLPFYNATAPSSIALNAEFAQLIPGHYENEYTGGYSFIDDFESAKSSIDIRYPSYWSLASTPNKKSMFPEASLVDNVDYGKNRAHIAWFGIDPLFNRKNSSLTPQHIKDDKDQQSLHFVREIKVSEIYPNRDQAYNENASLTPLNISYYPMQRGPYNLDAAGMNDDGTLSNPEKRWGGIMRRFDSKDFEAQNIEYIEFWLMDPFVYNNDPKRKDEFYNGGGELYINLGEISEDILKDGRKFYENGLPTDGDVTKYIENNWGRVPSQQSTVYAFDVNNSSKQDVGLNGLSTEQEKEHHSYKAYIESIRAKLPAETIRRMEDDPFSPLNDPGGDNYHYYRGNDYDRNQVSVLDRYKYYNGTEGNSTPVPGQDNLAGTARSTPDVEDIDSDNTMTETESFYEYKVELYPGMGVDDTRNKYIVDQQTIPIKLRNGDTEDITWYQFKIPIKEPDDKVGKINGFKSIRFARMYLTQFAEPVYLRFASLEMVRGDWRVYSGALEPNVPLGNGTLNTTTINIEENSKKEPVNYIMPPGVSRMTDPNQPQLTQLNEQAMSLRVDKLTTGDSRAIYRSTALDLRRYKRLQMFSHVEEVVNDPIGLNKGELSVFIRLGSDYKNNYYEYEIPLAVTPAGVYSNNSSAHRKIVWPESNMFDFALESLKNVKLSRNREKRKAGSTVSYSTLHSEKDPENPQNKISVIGNPSLAEVKVLMIGVRNNSRDTKSGEVWVNELRLTDFDEEGGWAAQGSLSVNLSDLATINVSGRKETSGFGSLEQSLTERRIDDYSMVNFSTNIDVGKLLPEKAKVSVPIYYAYSNQTSTPKYDPLDQDVTLDEALSLVSTKAEKDSIKNLAQTKTTTKSFSITNAKVDIKSKTPMPYDPANFTFGYAYSRTDASEPTVKYDIAKNYALNLNYNYSPQAKPWEPFKNSKSKAPITKYLKSLGFSYLPNNISLGSYITRNYTETMMRDMESYTLEDGGANSNQYLTFSQEFYWDREFSLSWDFLKNLKFSFQSGTRAEIEEPYLPVNKSLYRDEYEVWKDSVMQSIKNLGTPLSYKQSAKLTYTLPTNNIPFLDWISSSANYDATYRWDRGADAEEDLQTGNSLYNSVTYTLNNRLNLVSFYNKFDFLKKVNQKFDSSSRSSASNRNRPQQAQKAEKKKKFERQVKLNTDSVTIVKHNLNTKNIKVTARIDSLRRYMVKFKKIDKNTIAIQNKDSVAINISILQGPDPEENTWYKVAQYASRGLMSVRSLSFNYSRRQETSISGYKSQVGDVFGQRDTNSDFGLAPGLDFAFGFAGGESYIDKLLANDMLIHNDSISISPAIYNQTERFEFKAQLEPIRGLKIDLTTLRETSDRTEFQYMQNGMPRTYGGSFSMTTIALSSALKSSSSRNNYASATFDKFLAMRGVIAQRIENQYAGKKYPTGGFFTQLPGMGGADYRPGALSENSSDVLIPAFFAAYTGKSGSSASLNLFPTLTALLPNWSITYDGLIHVPWFKDKFKSFKLLHAYTCLYRIGAYSSASDWVQMSGDLGFVSNSTTGTMQAVPSSPYVIPSVSLTEAFNPLFGAEGTLNNSMTLRAKYNNNRSVSLNTSSYQVVENFTNELVFGLGYRISNFNRVIGITDRQTKGFNNDLNISADFKYNKTHAYIRKIIEGYTQATSGATKLTINLSADYALSKALTLKAYLERIVNDPLISTSSVPTTNTNFGISLRFTLNQ